MTRAVLSAAIDSDWRLVSQERPCPVCGSEDACSIHTHDAFACCAREPSDWKLTNGSCLHKLQAQASVELAETLPRLELAANGSAIRS